MNQYPWLLQQKRYAMFELCIFVLPLCLLLLVTCLWPSAPNFIPICLLGLGGLGFLWTISADVTVWDVNLLDGVRYHICPDGRIVCNERDLIMSPIAQAHYAEMERLYQAGLICKRES